MRSFWNSPKWYAVCAAVGVLVVGSAIALPDERSGNDVVMGSLFIASAGLGYLGSRSSGVVARRTLSALSFLMVGAAILTRVA
ncbi:MAG TPA: hypothetical protein VIN69_00540 [Candidatus Limnocylindria bacterium]